MFRLSSNETAGGYSGYMTFHRMDSNLIKSPSVGIPWRAVKLVLGVAVLAAAGYGALEMLQAGTLMDAAAPLLNSVGEHVGENLSLQLASELPPVL